MKRYIINTQNIDLSNFGDLAFAYGNECCSDEFMEAQRRLANLEVVVPNDNPAWAYHYFFDIRDCLNMDYRPVRSLESGVYEAVEKYRAAVQDYADNSEACEDDRTYNKVMALAKRLERLDEEAELIERELDALGITKEGIIKE